MGIYQKTTDKETRKNQNLKQICQILKIKKIYIPNCSRLEINTHANKKLVKNNLSVKDPYYKNKKNSKY